MQQVTTFDIAFEDGIAIGGKTHGVSGKLGGQIIGIRDCLQQALSTPVDRTPTSKPRTLSGYYGGAYERASAAVPVVSFRGLG